jgi:hypothetical protein
MTRYVWRNDRFEDRSTGEPMPTVDRISAPMVVRDVSYISPLSMKPVTSRSQRREEMKVHNVREVDPSEYRPTYHKRENAISARGEHEPRPKVDLGDGYKRLSRKDLPKRIAKTIAPTT